RADRRRQGRDRDAQARRGAEARRRAAARSDAAARSRHGPQGRAEEGPAGQGRRRQPLRQVAEGGDMLAHDMRKLAFLLIVFVSGTALAQQNNAKVAEQHFNLGQKAYTAGDYDKAMKEFLAAYQAFPANTLLFNIGQTYRMQGDKEKALAYYE